MIYSVAGTQGSGKTTILNELSNLGYNVIRRKTSRSILKDWNLSLDDIYNDKDLMIKFQNEVIIRKHTDELDHIDTTEVWFTDRSYIDLLVYSTVLLGYDDKYSIWLESYFDKCREFQNKYKATFCISPLPFVTSDGVRGSSIIYNSLVDYSIRGFLNKVNRSKIVDITTSSRSERIKIITNHIKSHQI